MTSPKQITRLALIIGGTSILGIIPMVLLRPNWGAFSWWPVMGLGLALLLLIVAYTRGAYLTAQHQAAMVDKLNELAHVHDLVLVDLHLPFNLKPAALIFDANFELAKVDGVCQFKLFTFRPFNANLVLQWLKFLHEGKAAFGVIEIILVICAIKWREDWAKVN